MTRDQKPRLLFISWAPYCSRSDGIAARLGGTSHMVYSPFWGSRVSTVLFKYLVQSWRTLRVLWRERPEVVFVMAPPVIACIPVWLYCLLTGARFAIDAHTVALLGARWRRLQFVQRFFSRRSVTTIVTNRFLNDLVESWGARATIVQDVPILFAEPKPTALEGCNMTMVNSFCPDEPLDAFLQAAREWPDIHFRVTGESYRLPTSLLDRKPSNVEFTGFLDDPEFVGLIRASDCVLALTTEDHTMQRAAYEAVYLETPVITSNFPLLKESFPKGAVHVTPTAEGISAGIGQMKRHLAQYRLEAQQLREEKLQVWERISIQLRHLLKIDSETNGPALKAASELLSHT